MLRLSNWNKSFGNHQVLKDIHLEVATGDVLTIIGSSGSGKSTLLRTINFLEPADNGTIEMADQAYDIEAISQADLLKIRRQTAMVFQNYALFSKKTALENVMESLIMVQKRSKKEAKDLARYYLNQVGWGTGKTTTPLTCRAASNSGLALPGPWPSSLRSSCLMNPLQPWTPNWLPVSWT
ncbi:Probable amino-acid import ATP-binding protein YxeO [Alloiococcus otitis]|uniref:Histidine transport ATP-binding protein HisP n=1 Tax=Alloiococcus otitis ATCC 51267 TaxID=883081 RepID=K9EW86_9LACT|nr:histidine transport ATP-binding protein HisP [Alloiococcus otitis ATCC 51267]SUU81461.1 Probable amino-acid import ATP-binding protein YxeO [Alloiococcus otitis]